MLELTGFEARAANDGLAAVGLALDFRPDAALLDLSLPGLDGFQVARHFRDSPALGRTFLIGLSGRRIENHEAQAAGFDHYIVKPVDVAALIDLLRSLPSGSA